MDKIVGTKQLKKNVGLSIIAQSVSLFVGFLFNLIVPKFLDTIQFAYWQVFALYVSYVGILHFGILDGILLRYSDCDYDKINKDKLKSQFGVLLFSTITFSIIGIIIALNCTDIPTRYIIILLSISTISINVFTYNSYTFQITNRIRQYALIVITQKLVYAFSVIFLLLVGTNTFYWFCIAEIIGDVIACILAVRYNTGMYLGSQMDTKDIITETWTNLSSGFFLLIANWSSMLLLGSARMIVQWRWDLLLFGKVSLAFSLTNMFLSFVTAASVAFFPSLKRLDKSKLPEMYSSIRKKASLFFFVFMILYFPCYKILDMWLPLYRDSFIYLGILLPIIVYSSKVTMLTNNYLKAYRKEKTMFNINVLSIIIAIAGFLTCAYYFDDVVYLLLWSVLVVIVRSVASEVIVSKIINKNYIIDYFIEFCVIIVFLICANVFKASLGLVLYTLTVLLFICLYSKQWLPQLKK